MPEHRAVLFLKNVPPDHDNQIRANAKNLAVEGRMVKFAEREAVRNDWLALRMTIGKDVRCFQKLDVAQAAHRAPLEIGAKDAMAKRRLMDPLQGD